LEDRVLFGSSLTVPIERSLSRFAYHQNAVVCQGNGPVMTYTSDLLKTQAGGAMTTSQMQPKQLILTTLLMIGTDEEATSFLLSLPSGIEIYYPSYRWYEAESHLIPLLPCSLSSLLLESFLIKPTWKPR